MSEDNALGQRELTAESQVSEFTPEERELIADNAGSILIEIVKASNKKTINAALGELSDFVTAKLAEPKAGEDAGADAGADAAAADADAGAGEGAGGDA
jgi:hypothetical protein